jgi:DNA-binding CsgD family transcriptional regulator
LVALSSRKAALDICAGQNCWGAILDALIDRIYEAALQPEIWPDVLTDLAGLANAQGAVLFAAGTGGANWIASPGLYEHARDYMQSDMPTYDDRTARLTRLAHPGFVIDYDVFTAEELDRDPIIRDFFRPRGLGFAVATIISAPTGDSFILHCERRFETGPVDRRTADQLDVYRPHLARAALLSAQFDMMRATATVNALQLLSLPAAVIRQNGKLFAVNEAMEQLMPSTLRETKGRTALANPAADQIFQRALALIGHAGHAGVQSIPIASSGAGRPMVAHIMPIPRSGSSREIFSGALAIVIITRVRVSEVLPSLLLESLFDLTHAEAKVARSIALGLQPQEIASQSGVAVETVRNQLKSVFGKVGVQSQAELVTLIGQLSL